MAELPLLEVSRIETCYGLSQVLFGMSIVIEPGEMVTLMGRNGMGKTTTVRSIMGLTPAMAGSIRFDGREIRGLAAYQVAKLGIGLVPEGRQVFPNLTARENLVATAANRNGAADPWTLERVCGLVPRLAERIANMANQLSGGEQQMLAIARGLMARPEVLMLDEPSLGLAPKLLEVLYDLLAELREEGTTILLVDQMATLALSVADRAYVLQSGTIKHSGSAREVAGDPALMRAYLGDHGTAR
jgi:branched-chain amino acid transport system ATP-binding protein